MMKRLPDVLRTVYAVRINAREQIKVVISEGGGRRWIDVRVWIRDLDGNLVSTSKGVSLRPDNARVIAKAIEAAADDDLIQAPGGGE